jgi:hypothetical protein
MKLIYCYNMSLDSRDDLEEFIVNVPVLRF